MLSVTVDVEYTDQRNFDRNLKLWWREFLTASANQERKGDYPPLIEVYLKSMLARRLALPLPVPSQRSSNSFLGAVQLLFDMESLRSEAIASGMMGLADTGTANRGLPSGIFWEPTSLDTRSLRDVQVEPIASAVPEECFYLRFGTWDNQIWMQRLMDEFNGDLGTMVSLRGYQSQVQSKFLDQMVIESGELDRLFGGNLIADIAVIGNDMFVEDGSAVGVLFHARSSRALESNLNGKRRKFVQQHEDAGCVISDVDVDGVKVQFLRTPDNRYRSFYVVQEPNHLITTSLSLVRRFIEASAGKRSLAENAEFRFARQQMPLSREDTVFVFVPSQFLQNLLGPQYQIELARRNRSIADMQMVELAGLAASHEGLDASNQKNLISHGFLPEKFGQRPDGSQLTRSKGQWVDSIRGRRGFYVPIPDVEMTGVTEQERSMFAQHRTWLAENLRSLDPMFIGLKRYEHEKNVERIVLDARIAPFGQEKYGWLFSMLGPPLEQYVQGSSDDIITIQASLRGGGFSQGIAEHHVFGAIQNEAVANADLKPNSLFRWLEIIQSIPGYIGSWPRAGFLDWIPILGSQMDENGFTHSRLLGLWRLQWDEYSAISFDRERLLELRQEVTTIPAERPSHVRLTVGNLAESRLRKWIDVQSYRRCWEASLANMKLVNMLSQQFGLPPHVALDRAQELLDVTLVCSLGGEYQLRETCPGREIWTSNAWPEFANPQLPKDYVSPLMKWFRGLELEVVKTNSQFMVHGYFDMERSGKSSLPSFNLFKGFGDMVGGKKNTD